MVKELLSIFFPETCPVCKDILLPGEDIVCTHCIFNLPVHPRHSVHDPVMEKELSGRANVVTCHSLFPFVKGSEVQGLLHALKYHGRPDIGVRLGQMLGSKMIFDKMPDCILPLPLHKDRQKKRGYNQSEKIAEGLSETTGIPVELNCLFRHRKSSTQTYKSREERLSSIQGSFGATKDLYQRSILLVDDVFTTGATIEACCEALEKVGVEAVVVATLARAEF